MNIELLDMNNFNKHCLMTKGSLGRNEYGNNYKLYSSLHWGKQHMLLFK